MSISAEMMKKKKTNILGKYHKRYFTLDLSKHTFSYKASPISHEIIFGVHLVQIMSIDEHAERANSPPKGYTIGYVVNTVTKRFVLFPAESDYHK